MIDPKLTDITMEMVMLTHNTMDHGKEPLLKPHHSLLHKTHSTLMNFLSRPFQEIEFLMIDPKLMDIMMEMVTLTPSMTVCGKDPSPKKRLLQFLHHRTHFILTNFHSRLSPETELPTIDPKLMVTTTVMAMSTLSMTDHGKELVLSPKNRQLHSLLHKTHCIPTSSLSRLSLEIESLMTDLKLTDITMEMVMLTHNTMDHGKELVLSPKNKQPHLLPHRTHCTPMNFHSRPSLEIESLMIDPKHTNITMEMVTLTLNTMDHGKVMDPSPKKRLLQFLLHKTHCTPTSSHSKPSLETESLMIDLKHTDITTVMVTLTPSMMDHGKELDPLLKQLHLPLLKTHCTPMNSHSKPSPETESLTTDPKHTDTTMVMVTSTPSMTVHGKVMVPSEISSF
jgi:hypothetical protein